MLRTMEEKRAPRSWHGLPNRNNQNKRQQEEDALLDRVLSLLLLIFAISARQVTSPS